MPNQNQPDPAQNQPQNPSSGIPFSPQADLPPLPPEFQNLDPKSSVVPENPTGSVGSAAPPVPTFSNIAMHSPKKRFGTGKIIATILGIFVLLGGVEAGLYLTRQQQNLGSLAAGCTYGCYQTDPMTGSKIWINDEEGLQSYRATLDDNDPRAEIIDNANQAAQQATCQSSGTCSCGSYTGEDGCTYCYTDCENRTTTSSDANIQAKFTALTLSGSCASGFWVCYDGCCGPNGARSTPIGYPDTSSFLREKVGIMVNKDSEGNITDVIKITNTEVSTKTPEELKGEYTFCKTNDGTKTLLCRNIPEGAGTNSCTCSTNEGYCIGGTWIEKDGVMICDYNGNYTCDGPASGGGDPCSTDGKTPGTCTGTGIIRCKCGSGAGSWVGGIADSCDELCGAANLPCSGTCGEPVTGTTDTSTLTPTTSYQCQTIKAYDSNWTLLDNDTLTNLKAGDVVRFSVVFVADGTIDKARFSVNGVLRPEVTTLKSGTTNEIYDEYTIPEGTTSFSITGQIHSTTIGWF